MKAIVQMARAADKDGSRTIGVLTKADTIEPGTHNNWLKILQGHNYELRLGYYCVVNPSQEDINNNISQEEAAAKEREFFERDSFFGSADVVSVRERFGVDALRVQLSKQLVSLTQRELPKMKEALDEVLAQTEAQLRKLPPPPASDPGFELFSRLRDLARAVAQAVEGSDDAGFFRAADKHYSQFRQSVLSARPTVRLTSSSSSSEAASAGTSSKATTSKGNTSSSSSTWQEEDAQFWLEGPETQSGDGSGEPEGLITLEKARQLAGQFRVRELPSFPPYRVLEELVQGLKGRWDAAAAECLHGVGEVLQQLTDRLVEEHFGQFAGARKEVRSLLYRLHDQLLSKAERHISSLMAMEREQVWTQNSHYMVSSKQCFQDMLTKQLYGSGAAAKALSETTPNFSGVVGKESLEQGLSLLASIGIKLSPEDLDMAVARKKQKTCQEDEGLLELIAGTLAYFKVSSKRVIDGVPMHLRHYLLQRFCSKLNDLPAQLAAGMVGLEGAGVGDINGNGTEGTASEGEEEGEGGGGGGTAGVEGGGRQQQLGGSGKQRLDAARLMAEDESTAERRGQLHRQLKQLQGVKMILNVF